MNKKKLTTIISGILLLTMIPINTETALSTTNPLSGDLLINTIEPIQVVQDTNILVRSKMTVIRLMIYSSFPTQVKPLIKITYDFGTKTFLEDGPLVSGVEIEPGYNTVYVPGGPVDLGSTWDPHGFLKWINTGLDSSLKAEIDPTNKIDETIETNNIKYIDSPITVADAPMLRYLFVPVVFLGEEDSIIPKSLIDEQKKFILATYPLADNDLFCYQTTPWHISFDPGLEIKDINWLYEVVVYPIMCVSHIMGYERVIICLKKPFGASGIAIGMLRTPEMREPVVIHQPDLGYMENLCAHEIGHTYYLWHPHDIGPPVYTDIKYDLDEQEYGEIANTSMSYRDPPWWIDKGRYDSDTKTIIPPSEYLPVATLRWNLADQLTEDPPTYTCIMVHGIIRNTGTISLNFSWFRGEAVPDLPKLNRAENDELYQIVLLNADNQVLSTFPFTVSFSYATHDDLTGELETAETDAMSFMFNILDNAAARYIQIQDENSQVIAEREITQNKPTVEVTYPNGGEKFKIGEKIIVQWNAFDQDQDTLRYTLAYSYDNGETWLPINFDIKDNSYEWNTYGLSKGKYLIKVIANDGINSGEDVSDGPFTIPKNKPINKVKYPSLFEILKILINKIGTAIQFLKVGPYL